MTSKITYEQMKKSYLEFKKNPPKDVFSRYLQEYNFTRSLIIFAKQQGLEKDVFEYQKQHDEAVKQLDNLRASNKQ